MKAMPHPIPPPSIGRIMRRIEEVLGMHSGKRRIAEVFSRRRLDHDADLERSRLERQEVERRIRKGREELADIAYQSLQAESAAEDY
jgi:hypothetical protein